MDRSQIRNRSSYDLGTVTDLILRLNPNRRNLLYLTRRSFHSVRHRGRERKTASGGGIRAYESPVKAVVLSKEQGATMT